jgi:regulator of sigma E protease
VGERGGIKGVAKMSILSAILLFGFLVFIHELGHFLLAKASGVKVLTFSLGFGPKIIGKKIGETEYLLSAVPLGGYVKMLGEDVEDEVGVYEAERAYKNQKIYKKAAIVFAGPVFNLLTAVAIFFFIALSGLPVLMTTIGDVMPGTPAAKALVKGDKVLKINSKPISHWDEMSEIIARSAGKELTVTVQRGSETMDVTMTPEPKKVKSIFGEEELRGIVGIRPAGEITTVRYGIADSLATGFSKTWEIIVMTFMGIVKLIERVIPSDSIGGPILIFQMAEQQATAGALSFFTFAAVISINLGILNLLPIPVLDGGHLFFLGLEAILRRPVSERVILMAQRIGLALIVSLMIFAMYNDLLRLISGKPIPS